MGLLTPSEKTKYREMIGSLMYVSMMTRPDITFVIISLLHFPCPPICFPYLHRWSPLFYFYSFHQNLLIHMPFFHFLHSLMHSLQNLLFNEHSLKAILSFSIKHFQVGYLSLSLDLNVL